jgi:hypothetical protein
MILVICSSPDEIVTAIKAAEDRMDTAYDNFDDEAYEGAAESASRHFIQLSEMVGLDKATEMVEGI